MAHFDGREVGHSNTSCARYEKCHSEHHMIMTAKGSRHAFGMAKTCVRSVPTGVCMSTPLRTGATLDKSTLCILMGERLLALVQEMRALSDVPYVVSTF